jgi:hypothetical protein
MGKFEENDVQIYFCQVVQLVGQRIGISDALWKSSAEVFDAIETTNMDLLDKLKCFFDAYQAWWAYDKKLEGEEKMGNLTSEEFNERERLVSNRDQSRNCFIEMLP